MDLRKLLRLVSSAVVLTATLAVVVGPSSPVMAATLDATGRTFIFGEGWQNVVGTALSERLSPGDFTTYRDVTAEGFTNGPGPVIDARVTFVRGQNTQGGSSNVTLGDLDRLDSNAPTHALDHRIRRTSAGTEAMAEIKIEFFETGTQLPVTVSALKVNFYDIDDRQSVEVDGVASYSLAPTSILDVSSPNPGTVRFSELNSIETGVNATTGFGTAYTLGRASVTFANTSVVTYRIIINADSGGGSAGFEVDFSEGVPWEDENGLVTPTVNTGVVNPVSQNISGVVGCPLATAALSTSNFGGAVTFVSTSAVAPAGLTFNSNTGAFSGTPSAPSSALVSVTASGSVSGSAVSTYVFNVTDGPLTLTPSSQTISGVPGTALSTMSALAATANCDSVVYSITSGTLPAGLSFNASTGAITGTPTSASTETITITATDALARTATSTVIFDLAVSSSNTPTPSVPSPSPQPESPPTISASPTPVPAPGGGLPALRPTEALVTENGVPVTVELIVENDEALVLRSQDFELRLRGACTTGCTIVEDSNGRETIHLDRSGGARVSGFGFLPGSLVHVWIFSEPHYLGALLVASDGTYSGVFPLNEIETGSHTLQANGYSFDNLPRSANLGIVVVDNQEPSPIVNALPEAGLSAAHLSVLSALLTLIGAITLIARRKRII